MHITCSGYEVVTTISIARTFFFMWYIFGVLLFLNVITASLLVCHQLMCYVVTFVFVTLMCDVIVTIEFIFVLLYISTHSEEI
jgi:hypothetical protein